MGGRQLHLGAVLWAHGNHVASWKHPDVPADSATSLAYFRKAAQICERGLFDLLFLADSLSLSNQVYSAGRSGEVICLEPLTLLSALSQATDHIGLIATASTTYSEPFNIARQFATLDILSGGRAGWNVVTTSDESSAQNFGRDSHLDHGIRYERAREFVECVDALWDSWDDDAFVRDRQRGLYFDPAKMHVADFKGDFIAARGPLNVQRSAQGHPVVVQSGSSEPGRQLAAATAEIVFTAQADLAPAQAFYADIKERVVAAGREPDQVLIMPGIVPIVGRSMSEAQEKFALLQELVEPEVGLAFLSKQLGGFDLSHLSLDDPIPDLPDTNSGKSRLAEILKTSREGNMTLRTLFGYIAGNRGHRQIIGTPEDVADHMEMWLRENAADGFNIMPAWMPGALEDFVDLVIPVLQSRQLFRREYEGHTLRDRLGLRRRPSRFAVREVGISSGG